MNSFGGEKTEVSKEKDENIACFTSFLKTEETRVIKRDLNKIGNFCDAVWGPR